MTQKPKSQRYSLKNVLPPLFTGIVISGIYLTYTCLHLLPLIQLNRTHGLIQFVVAQSLSVIFFVSMIRAVYTDPGMIPNDPEWLIDGPEEGFMPDVREVKVTTGQRRHCKWCNKFKPDRCHHCRVCQRCVLRMDHHCPWIMTCIGQHNYKYFFLLIFYGMIICWLFGSTMMGTVMRSQTEEMSILRRFFHAFGITLQVLMGALLTLFAGFHTYLLAHASTTIEFCEKFGTVGSPYDRGLYGNLCEVLGENVLLWFLPVSPPTGDGVNWRKSLKHADSISESFQPPDSEPEWTGNDVHF